MRPIFLKCLKLNIFGYLNFYSNLIHWVFKKFVDQNNLLEVVCIQLGVHILLETPETGANWEHFVLVFCLGFSVGFFRSARTPSSMSFRFPFKFLLCIG